MYAPGNKEGSQMASNDGGNGAITTPGNAYNKPASPLSNPMGAGQQRPATPPAPSNP